jgi:hypothetical protein
MKNWYTWDGSSINLNTCEDFKLFLKADPNNPNDKGFAYSDDGGMEHHFVINGSVAASGNIQYLLTSEGGNTVPNNGFLKLFSNCTTLTSAPDLPATHFGEFCYTLMFENCTSLTKAPYLPKPENFNGQYQYMFNGCSNLNEIEVGFTEWNDMSMEGWLYNVSPTGTFICPKELPDNRMFIPKSWEIIRK